MLRRPSRSSSHSAPAAGRRGRRHRLARGAADPDGRRSPSVRFKEPTRHLRLTPRFRPAAQRGDRPRPHVPSPVASDVRENDTSTPSYSPRPARASSARWRTRHHAGEHHDARGATLAGPERRVAALVVCAPALQPAAPPRDRVQLVSTDIPRTLAGIRQGRTRLPVRAGVAGVPPEVDPTARHGRHQPGQLPDGAHVRRTSRGLKDVCMVLGGGGWWTRTTTTRRGRRCASVLGRGRRARRGQAELIAPVDPITYAANSRGRTSDDRGHARTTWCRRGGHRVYGKRRKQRNRVLDAGQLTRPCRPMTSAGTPRHFRPM
jgi:hypothetical protein